MKRPDRRKGILAVLGIAVLMLPMGLSAQVAPKGRLVIGVRIS